MSDILYLNYLDGNGSSNSVTFANFLDGGYSNTTSFSGTINALTSEPRIKERISTLVRKQLPEFIQTEFNTFVKFLEYYYKFLEQDLHAQEIIQNARSYADIDKTVPSFVYYFLQTYGKDIPTSILGDTKLLVKRLNDLYESKGSSLSFKLLFRLLYNTEIEIKYPYENILRASDGTFQQKRTIRVTTLAGDRSQIINKFLTYTVNNATFDTPILATKFINSTLTEITLDNNKLASSYNVGDTVNVYGPNKILLFSSAIERTTTDFSIRQKGSEFKVGQIFNINFSGGVDSLVKITEVDSNGGINKLKFINFGYGYPELFTIFLDKDSIISQTVDAIGSGTLGFSETVTLLTCNASSSSRYFDTDYVDVTYSASDVVQTSNVDIKSDVIGQSIPANFAQISLFTGALAKYPGFYTTNRGFISDSEIRLENDLLYQPFAYQINSEIDIDKFYNIIIDLVHPAGQRLFNNRVFINNLDVSANVATSNINIGPIDFEAHNSVDIASVFTTSLSRIIEGIFTVEPTDNNIFTLNQTNAENIDILDTSSFTYSTFIFDDISLTDIQGFLRNELADLEIVLDSVESIAINKEITEDIEELSDTGLVTLQDYVEGSFFLEDYTGTLTSF